MNINDRMTRALGNQITMDTNRPIIDKVITINEGAVEKAAVDFLSKTIKSSRFRGKVYIAGGYVRDELLGFDPKDIDLVVELPNGGIDFANWITKKTGTFKKGSNPVVFPKFGTAKFQLHGVKHKGHDLSSIEIEVVMTRKEKYHDDQGRKPDVSPGTLKDDVERRDFTVNSMLKDLTTGEIVDLTGMGKRDLKAGVIQTPLDPDVIFSEDPLRMLRAIRFTVKYNWKLPMFMIRSMKKNSSKLKNISAERIRSELDKILVTKHPDKGIRLLQITGLNKSVAPELDKLIGMSQNKYHDRDVMKHTLKVLRGTPAKLETRLAALFHDIGKGDTKTVVDNEIHFYKHEDVGAELTASIMKRLKYPNDVIDKVVVAVANHMRTKRSGDAGDISDKALRKLSRRLGDHLEDTLDLIHADNIAHHPDYNMPNQVANIRTKLKNLKAVEKASPKLPVNGREIMKALGIKGGPWIGKLIALVQDAWDEDPSISKDQAIELVKVGYKELTK
jgi:putative nucleotidyltransferase with HDIG domain